MLRQYKQVHFVEVQEHAIRQSFARIGHTLRHLKEDRQVFWFLLAFFCYIDGVYTKMCIRDRSISRLHTAGPRCCSTTLWMCSRSLISR